MWAVVSKQVGGSLTELVGFEKNAFPLRGPAVIDLGAPLFTLGTPRACGYIYASPPETCFCVGNDLNGFLMCTLLTTRSGREQKSKTNPVGFLRDFERANIGKTSLFCVFFSCFRCFHTHEAKLEQ